MVTGGTLDFILIGIFVVLLLIGMRVGLINMVAAVGVAVSSSFAISLFGDDLVGIVNDSVDFDDSVIQIVTYIVIVLVALAVFAILARIVKKTLKVAWLGWVDLLGGAAVGITASLVIFSILSAAGVWIFDLSDAAVTGLGAFAPEVLVSSSEWIGTQLSSSFIATTLGVPLWDGFNWLLPDTVLGVSKDTISAALDRFQAAN